MGLLRSQPSGLADVLSHKPTRFVDRSARGAADAALAEAGALMQALTELRLGTCGPDTAANAAHVARETRAVVTLLQVAVGRLDARVEGR